MIDSAASRPAKVARHRRWPSLSHARMQPTITDTRQLVPSVLPFAPQTWRHGIPPSRLRATRFTQSLRYPTHVALKSP
jgi:hypothetical protein